MSSRTRVAGVRDAMIVAGGAGSRLWPLTEHTPKPLLPFCGVPFLSGVLRRLAAAGVDHVLLIVGADTSPFAVLEEDAARVGITLEAVPEPQPLDTAGGVRLALDRVRGTFLVLNGDILTDLDLAVVVAEHVDSGADATLALTRVEDTSAYGVCVLDGDRIVGFVEKPPPGSLPGQDAVNAGTYVLEPGAIERFPTGPLSFERTVFPSLVASGADVRGHVTAAVWADLGTPQRLLDGHRLALDGALRWPTLADLTRDEGVWRGAGVEVDAAATVRAPVLLGAGTRLAAGASVGPHVVVGVDGDIGAGTRLEHSVLGSGTVLEDGVSAEGLLTGVGARVGRGARVVGPAVLGDGQTLAAAASLHPGDTLPPRR